jgi:DNA-binding MarR family transcriptional regulator
VLALATAQIDLVARHLLGERIELLCDPSPAQRVVALAHACRRMPPTLQEGLSDTVRSDREPFLHPGRESDEERLRRLTDGMARISRFAADFVHNHPVTGAAELGDRRTRFDGEPAIGHAVRPQDVRRVIHRRQLRSKFFGQFGGEALFEDPAWDMLLDLFAAELEGVQVSVSSLCIAAGVAPTTALRWIAKMTEMELFIRHPDPADRRRAFMTLSPRASEAMQAYMIALRKIEAAG